MRRDLERVAARNGAKRKTDMALNGSGLTRSLEELIAALDRRLPRVEAAGEVAIARDAAALRAKAVRRLAQLTDETADVAAAVASMR